jgi:hypothetical protein
MTETDKLKHIQSLCISESKENRTEKRKHKLWQRTTVHEPTRQWKSDMICNTNGKNIGNRSGIENA